MRTSLIQRVAAHPLVTTTLPALGRQFREYGLLMRVDRPIGTLLLLWPTLWALWISGQGRPQPDVFIVFVLGVFLMRSAGCAINDYADRNIDPHVRRTSGRPLATGTVAPLEALLLAAGLSVIAFGLVLTLNKLTVYYALGGALLAGIYPFLKRYTSLPQVWLGAAFGWSVPMAWAAQTEAVPQLAWLLFLAVVMWAVVYDTMYAMVDREDDLRIGVRSTAILFGELDRAAIAGMQVMMFGALLLVGKNAKLGGWYLAGLAVAAGCALWQQYVIRHREPEACFRAFLNNNWLGLAVFVGVVLDYTFRVHGG